MSARALSAGVLHSPGLAETYGGLEGGKGLGRVRGGSRVGPDQVQVRSGAGPEQVWGGSGVGP